MKKLVAILLTVLMIFSFLPKVLRGSVVKAADYQWVSVNNGLTNIDVRSLAIDPTNTQVIYAGTYYGGIFKSTNGGLNWTKTGLPSYFAQSLAIDPTNTQVIYAGMACGCGGGLFKSTDGGASWSVINTGLTNIYIYSLAIDPTNTQTIYVGTLNGLFKSIDGGGLWTAINNGLTNQYVRSLVIDPPPNTQTIYAGTDGGVFKSTDGGASWSVINTGLTNIYIYSLAIDPTNTQIIYAGTGGGGVFKTSQTFTITASAGVNGSISPTGVVTVNYGTNQAFTITPNTGYHIKDVLVDGASVGAASSYTFTKITSDHTIYAAFEKEITQTVIILQIGKTSFTVNGVSNTLDSPPIIKNSRTLLPIRAIIESLGGTVEWDATAKKVTVNLGSNTIELWIGKSTAKVNGLNTPIDSTNNKVVPEIINSRTRLPLRFVAENVGATVDWNGTTQTVTITYQR